MEAKVTQGHVQAVESADQRSRGVEIYSLLRSAWCAYFEVKGGRFFRLSWTLKCTPDHGMSLLRADGNDQSMVELYVLANPLIETREERTVSSGH